MDDSTAKYFGLDEFMCGGLNRTGLLCGKCQSGLGPVVFSSA